MVILGFHQFYAVPIQTYFFFKKDSAGIKQYQRQKARLYLVIDMPNCEIVS